MVAIFYLLIAKFCRYSRVLAPKNFLSTPEEVFGEGKLFDKEVEEKTRLAFRVTMKKLDKLNTLSEERREELAREKIDQVVECFPNSLPEDLPKILGKTKWSMPAKEVSNILTPGIPNSYSCCEKPG